MFIELARWLNQGSEVNGIRCIIKNCGVSSDYLRDRDKDVEYSVLLLLALDK